MRDKFYREAREDRIVRPQKPRRGSSFDRWVTKDSQLWQRKHFVQIRRYQSLECDDGMAMTTSDDCWRDFIAYSFLSDYYDEKLGERLWWLIGAAGFTKNENETTLEFCWLHPFWRGKGFLRRAWPEFREHLGEFRVSKPRSKAMSAFLAHVGHQDPLRRKTD